MSTAKSGLLFGRFAEQGPLTGYEPNDPDLRLRRGHRHYSCCIGGGPKIRFGNAGLTTVKLGERQVRLHSGFITLTEKILRHDHHTVVPVRGDPWRCAHTRVGQVEIRISRRSPTQKKNEFSVNIEKSAISLNCERSPIRAGYARIEGPNTVIWTHQNYIPED